MAHDIKPVVDAFVERMGFAAQADGLPRIAGRILGLLVIEAGPFSFSDLAERLRVSRGSISTNTRLLEHLGVLERVAKPGERQDYFRLSDDPYTRLLRGSVERMTKTHDFVVRAQNAMPPDQAAARGRLAALAAFYRETSEAIARIAGAIAKPD